MGAKVKELSNGMINLTEADKRVMILREMDEESVQGEEHLS